MDISGVYKISCLKNNKCYIGSAINIRKRWSTHKHELSKNKHPNIKLQNAWNKYGCEQFIFSVVKECKKEELLILEEKYIKDYNSYDNGFNIIQTPTKNMLGYKHTILSLDKMSKSAKERGRNHSCLSKQQVEQIRQKFYNGINIVPLAKEYNVNRKTIRECVYLKTYTDIECNIDGYNDMLKDIIEKRKEGKRPKSSGWNHTNEFKERFRKSVAGPKLSIRKLTIEQIINIRNEKNNGSTCKQLAEKYNVNQNTISKICRRLIYQDIE